MISSAVSGIEEGNWVQASWVQASWASLSSSFLFRRKTDQLQLAAQLTCVGSSLILISLVGFNLGSGNTSHACYTSKCAMKLGSGNTSHARYTSKCAMKLGSGNTSHARYTSKCAMKLEICMIKSLSLIPSYIEKKKQFLFAFGIFTCNNTDSNKVVLC